MFSKRVAILLLGFLLFKSNCPSQAQTPRIDSLKRILLVASDKDKLEIKHKLTNEYETALRQVLETHREATQKGDTLLYVRAGTLASKYYRLLGKHDSSVMLSVKILPVSERNSMDEITADIYSDLGSIANYQASYDKALEYHMKALEVYRKLKDKAAIADIQAAIGFDYYKISDWDKALKFSEEAVQSYSALGDSVNIIPALNNLALIFINKNDLETARKHFTEIIKFCGNKCENTNVIMLEFTRGEIFKKEEDYVAAEKSYRRSLELAKLNNNGRYILDNTIRLSFIYLATGKIREAEASLIEAENFEYGFSYNKELVEIYEQLFKLYEKKGNLQKMTLYQQKYITLKDSIYSRDLTNNLMRVEAEYQEKENKARISAQSEMLELKDEVISRQRLLNVLAVFAALLLISLVYLLYRLNRNRKRANQLLDRKVEQRTRELQASYENLKVTMEESDLELAKTASGIKSSMATMKGLVSIGLKEADDVETKDRLNKIDTKVNTIIEIVQKMEEEKNVSS